MFSFIRPIRALAITAAAAVTFTASGSFAATVLPLKDHSVESVAATAAVSFDMDLYVDLVKWAGSSLNPVVGYSGNWDRNQGGGPETFKLAVTDFTNGASLDATGLVYDMDFAELQFEVLFKKQAATGQYADLSDELLLVIQFTADQLNGYLGSGVYTGTVGAQVFETVAATPVPVPASGLLLIAGLAGAGAFGRRRQQV